MKTTLNRNDRIPYPHIFQIMNQLLKKKNESFCVVCIITYVTVVLLFKGGCNLDMHSVVYFV